MAQGKLQGMDKVIARLNKEILALKSISIQGLIEASIVIRRDMEVTSPVIPVDMGNLRASWFTVTKISTTKEGGFKGKDKGQVMQDTNAAVTNAKGVVNTLKVPILIMGFGANYAVYVHENVGANFTGKGEGDRRQGAGAKFLEASLNRNKAEVLKILRNNLIIPK